MIDLIIGAELDAGEITDFNRSSCTWMLKEQSSLGRFEVDASLSIKGRDQIFFLGAQVFAGNVYGNGKLIIEPPYGFSAAFSETTYRIFRDPAFGSVREDSAGNHSNIFDQIHFSIVKVAVEELNKNKLVDHLLLPAQLLARIELAETEELSAGTLELPARHVNVRPTDGCFQVETGPVLIALRGSGKEEERLRRVYIAFSENDEASLIIDNNRTGDARKPWDMIVQAPCKATIFAVSDSI